MRERNRPRRENTMAHIPVNHPLRTVYRALCGLVGLYVLVFGVVGLVQTRGLSLFQQHGLPWVLGLRANPAFALLSIVAGAVILLATLVARNIDHFVYLAGGVVFMVAGMAMMALMQTDANIFGFTMTNCIVSFIIGTILLAAGLYTKSGSQEQAAAEDQFRHSGAGARTPAERPAS
jgi:hypothetical protein